jgi:hypothetical protein
MKKALLLLALLALTGCTSIEGFVERALCIETVTVECRHNNRGVHAALVQKFGKDNVVVVTAFNDNGDGHAWCEVKNDAGEVIYWTESWRIDLVLWKSNPNKQFTHDRVELEPTNLFDYPPNVQWSTKQNSQFANLAAKEHAPQAGKRHKAKLWPGGRKPTNE